MTVPEPTLLDVLDLERIEVDLFRAPLVFDDGWALYGGQVAAQALLAAGATVDADRRPHSLHGYFLRKGDSRVPTVFKVSRDRDGRSFSARRVVAVQHGKVIFNMSTSFQVPSPGPVVQAVTMPETQGPDGLPDAELRRLFSFDARRPAQPYAERTPWPTRFWARATVDLPGDPLLQACALTYLSDISTGILPAADGRGNPSSSLDHSVWFHSPVDLNEWTLSDYQPRFAGHGRGWYTGAVFDRAGQLVASIAQEALFREVSDFTR